MWKEYNYCKHCGYHCNSGDMNFTFAWHPCASCGERDWAIIKIGRFISTAIWWNPTTWGRGETEWID